MPFSDAIIDTIDNEQLRSFVQTLLDTTERQSVQIEKLTQENEQLHAEIRHLKKQKGKPKIRPNTPDKNDQNNNSPDTDVDQNNQGKSNNNTPPKGKRSRSQEPGGTAAPPLTVDKDEVCSIDNPGEDWRFKGYIDFRNCSYLTGKTEILAL